MINDLQYEKDKEETKKQQLNSIISYLGKS